MPEIDRSIMLRHTQASMEAINFKKLSHPFSAIGDGGNDAEMLRFADIRIAFGGARQTSVAEIC